MRHKDIHAFLKILAEGVAAEWKKVPYGSELSINTACLAGSISAMQIDDGVSVLVNKLSINKPLNFSSFTTQAFFKMSFYVEADFLQENSEAGESQLIEKESCRAIFFNKKGRNSIIPNSPQVNSLDIVLRPGLLKKSVKLMPHCWFRDKFAGMAVQDKNISFVAPTPLTVLPLVKEIIHLSGTSKLCAFLKVRSLVYELLSEMFGQAALFEYEEQADRFLTRADLAKLYLARDYLKANIFKPPTLKELSKIVGLNDFKLKKGFRNVFNTTVHKFSVEQRLCASCALLTRSDCPISEIGYGVGYHCPSKFIQTFKKKFGITPGQYRKTSYRTL